jgi:hypothetical protein
MHWFEGVIMIGAGFFAWIFATDRFPSEPAKREEMFRRAPWMRHKKLFWAMAVFLWMLGIAGIFGLM